MAKRQRQQGLVSIFSADRPIITSREPEAGGVVSECGGRKTTTDEVCGMPNASISGREVTLIGGESMRQLARSGILVARREATAMHRDAPTEV